MLYMSMTLPTSEQTNTKRSYQNLIKTNRTNLQ